MKQKEQKWPTQVLVTSQFLKNGTPHGKAVSKDELVAVTKFVTEPAKVTVEYGLTLNLGNYEAAKIGVSVSVPCYFEELNKAYEWAAKWAEDRVNQERDAIRKSLLKSLSDVG